MLFAPLLALAPAAACRCPDPYFAKGRLFTATVVAGTDAHACDSAPGLPLPTFVPADTFLLAGTGDVTSSEAGMCDDGTLQPVSDAPWFATDVLKTCSANVNRCQGTTASGCMVSAAFELSFTPPIDGGAPQAMGSLQLHWSPIPSCSTNITTCTEDFQIRFAPANR